MLYSTRHLKEALQPSSSENRFIIESVSVECVCSDLTRSLARDKQAINILKTNNLFCFRN